MNHSPLACIVPPDLLRDIIREGSERDREAAADTMAVDQTFRTLRAAFAATTASNPAAMRTMGGAGGKPHRTIYDQKNSNLIALGTVARAEGAKKVKDPAVNEAYDGFGATYKFFWDVLGRNSIDNAGMPILGLVHFSTNYANAFWDGQGHMFFGDGDGQLFVRLTKSLDVIGHELTHGVIDSEAGLVYMGQPGALNESLADVFGSLVKQFVAKEDAEDADWLIGEGLFTSSVNGDALRSMAAPGEAYDDPVLGKDPQPSHMKDFVRTTADYGGVHINSGIPNHAFYRVATELGGPAWERAGLIWYETLRSPGLKPRTAFRAFAGITLRVATRVFGPGSDEVAAVRNGWTAVGIELGPAARRRRHRPSGLGATAPWRAGAHEGTSAPSGGGSRGKGSRSGSRSRAG